MTNLLFRSDNLLETTEKKTGQLVFAILAGIMMVLIAMLASTPRFQAEYHGNGFTRLSLNPFILSNEEDLRFRILSPLLGWLFFFRGASFKFFMLAILAIFYASVYFFARKKNYRPAESLILTAILAFSTLSYYQLYYPAYNDPLSFLLIFLAIIYIDRFILSTILFSLMLFNHENTIFLFPFLFLLAIGKEINAQKIAWVCLRFIIALIPYFIFRNILKSNTVIEYDLAYYFDPHNMEWTWQHVRPNLIAGFFQAFKFSWIFPIIASYLCIREKRWKEILLMAAVVVPVLSQLIIAYDVSRLIGLSFPIFLISAKRVYESKGRNYFLLTGSICVLINFFVPSYCIGANGGTYYGPFWLH